MLALSRCAGLALTTLLAAQNRQPLAGRVLQTDGKPAAGATVTLVFSDELVRGLMPTQILHATADASGRFRIDVTPGLTWTGWATLPIDDDTAAVSQVTEHLAPGVRCEFLLERTARARTVTIEHAAAWQREVGHLSLRVAPWAANLAEVELPLPADGLVRLPPLPGERHHLAIVDRHGAVLHAMQIAADATTAPLPPPMPIPIRVVDTSGKPVAGAEILHEVKRCEVPFGTFPRPAACRRFRHAATTGADGTTIALVPSAKSPFTNPEIALFLLARKNGFAESMSGWDGAQLENSASNPAAADRLSFILEPESPCRGRVTGARPGTRVQIVADCTLRHDDHLATWQRAWTVPVDANGAFACGDMPPHAEIRHLVATVAEREHAGAWPQLTTIWPDSPTDREFAFDLRANRAISLFATLANGDPAAGARVIAMPLIEPADAVLGWADRGSADAGGRLALRISRGDWLIWIATEAECGAFVVHEGDREREERLRLEPFALMRGKIVDAALQPIATAQLELVSCESSGEAAKSTLDRCLDQIAFWHTEACAHNTSTGERGEFALPFLMRPALTIQVQASRDRRACSPFTLIDGTAADPFVVPPGK